MKKIKSSFTAEIEVVYEGPKGEARHVFTRFSPSLAEVKEHCLGTVSDFYRIAGLKVKTFFITGEDRVITTLEVK